MKRLIVFAVLILAASAAFAQEATLPTPIAQPTLTTYRVIDFEVHFRTNRASVYVVLVNSADGATVERQFDRFDISDRADTAPNEFRLFIACVGSVQTGETGGGERILKFRLLKCAQAFGEAKLVGATIAP